MWRFGGCLCPNDARTEVAGGRNRRRLNQWREGNRRCGGSGGRDLSGWWRRII